MDLLFITDVFPYPPHSGNAVVAFHWIRSLAPCHSIRLISVMPPEDCGARRELEKIGVSLCGCEAPLVWSRSVRNFTSWMPTAMRRLRVQGLLAAVEHAVKMRSADKIVAIGPALGALLPRIRRLRPAVFVPYDAESLNSGMRARFVRGTARRMYFRIEALKWQYVEAHYYPLADACVAVTEEDADGISRRWVDSAHSRVHVIPNGVDVTHFSPWPAAEIPGRIVIHGNMRSIDTEVSIRWFVQAVLPRIQEHIPTASLEIVGRDPLPSLRVLAAQMEGVNLTGYVPDLRPYLAQASVYVAPLRLGSGIKNRVLEAMAMGRPVVATPLAVQGLQIQPGRDVLTATTEDVFAQTVIGILQDRDRQRRLGQAAREAIVANHAWSTIGSRVEDMLRGLTVPGRMQSIVPSSSMEIESSPTDDRARKAGGRLSPRSIRRIGGSKL